MDKLHAGQKFDETRAEPGKMEVIGNLMADKLKWAYNVGCTFNVTGFSPSPQYFYVCKDCEKETLEEVGICECCALFCHAGHKVVIGAYAKKVKTQCDCGGGVLDGVPKLNSGNPLSTLYSSFKAVSKCSLRESCDNNFGDAVSKFICAKYILGVDMKSTLTQNLGKERENRIDMKQRLRKTLS